LKRRQYFIALRPVVWLVSTKQEFFACFWMCFILFLFVFYRVQVSMFFRQWSNIFLADQDERQRCFFADQKQFPADHWSLIGRYFEPCNYYTKQIFLPSPQKGRNFLRGGKSRSKGVVKKGAQPLPDKLISLFPRNRSWKKELSSTVPGK
jgi:hypothetical protein